MGHQGATATGPGLQGDGLLLAIGFPHKLEKGFHCLHSPADGCPADEPWGGARRICWVKMDMVRVDKGQCRSRHGVTWHASNVQTLQRAGRREGVSSGRVAVVCVQLQVQDVLFYGDWRERRRSDLSPEESPAHCVMSTPARQHWLLSNHSCRNWGSTAQGNSINLNTNSTNFSPPGAV